MTVKERSPPPLAPTQQRRATPMRNIPVNLTGYRLTIAEEPEMKMRKDDKGREEVVTDREGSPKFVVSLFAKVKGEKGEEIRVTLDADPGEGFVDDTRVELI